MKEEKKIKTFISVDERPWRELKAYAAKRGIKVSEALEEVLFDYFELKKEVKKNE